MQRHLRSVAIVAGLGLALTAVAFGAEQTIKGKGLTIKDGSSGVDPAKRKISGKAAEKNSPNTILGDPVAGGGVLEVQANGSNSTAQTFVLNQGISSTGKPFWSTAGNTGFKYKDSRGDQGPVKSVLIKRSPGGNFTIKATLTGRNGTINVVPPNPGTDGCMALTLASGDRYSVAFGPESDVKNSGAKLFKAKKPQIEAVCPGGGPTTTTTTTTTNAPTTTTTLYGSPSRAFLERTPDLLD